MANHKSQHYIPVGYLKSWCDPVAPRKYAPYVWVFSKDGRTGKRKSPKKIFCESNFYTIKRADGKRDLRLEKGLSELEDKFCSLRDIKLKFHQALTSEENIILCAFITAMYYRTKIMRAHQQQRWQGVLDMMDKMRERARTATPEQLEAVSQVPQVRRQARTPLKYADVKKLARDPVQYFLLPAIRTATPLLSMIDLAILETDDQIGFITSDNPCVWSDPEAHKRPPLDRSPALMYDSIEITFPISSWQAALLNRKGFNGYFPINEKTVDKLNRITRYHAYKEFVVNSNRTKDIWFNLKRQNE